MTKSRLKVNKGSILKGEKDKCASSGWSPYHFQPCTSSLPLSASPCFPWGPDRIQPRGAVHQGALPYLRLSCAWCQLRNVRVLLPICLSGMQKTWHERMRDDLRDGSSKVRAGKSDDCEWMDLQILSGSLESVGRSKNQDSQTSKGDS